MAKSSPTLSNTLSGRTLCLTLKKTIDETRNKNFDDGHFVLDLNQTKSVDMCANPVVTNSAKDEAFRSSQNDELLDEHLNDGEKECLKCKSQIDKLNLIIEIQRQEKQEMTRAMSLSVSQGPISLSLKSCEVQTESLIGETCSDTSHRLDIASLDNYTADVVIPEVSHNENSDLNSLYSATTVLVCHDMDTEMKQIIDSNKNDAFNSNSLEVIYKPPSYSSETQTFNSDSMATNDDDYDDIGLSSFEILDYPSRAENIVIHQHQENASKKKLFAGLKFKLSNIKAKITKKCRKNISVICKRCPKCNNIFESDMLIDENELCKNCARQRTVSASDIEIMNN